MRRVKWKVQQQSNSICQSKSCRLRTTVYRTLDQRVEKVQTRSLSNSSILRFPFCITFDMGRGRWEHWDSNPGPRVTSRVIAPVNHHGVRWPSSNHPLTGARDDAWLHHAPILYTIISSAYGLSSLFSFSSFSTSSASFLSFSMPLSFSSSWYLF